MQVIYRFEVFIAELLRIQVLWDSMLCQLVKQLVDPFPWFKSFCIYGWIIQ